MRGILMLMCTGGKMKKIKIVLLCLWVLSIVACVPDYTINHASPVDPISFPEDEAAHYWAQNEWWYYTGHLTSEDGREFGYQLTFFKRITNEDLIPDFFIPVPAYWLKGMGMLGHFTVTDISNQEFMFADVNDFLGLPSKADDKKYDVMIGNWRARSENGKHILTAEMVGCSIELELDATKPAALHGKNGIADKGANHSNYYYSFTNMKTTGTLTLDGRPIKVHGKSWMDHEYGTMKLVYPQSGWDWFSVQLDNDHELMIYVIRNDSGDQLNLVGGSFIMPNGKTIPLKSGDVEIKNLDYWYSKKTDAKYPASWEITVKSLNLKLKARPVVAHQEVNLKPMPYWEGSVRIEGTYKNRPVKGKGYFELVGYSKKYPMNYI